MARWLSGLVHEISVIGKVLSLTPTEAISFFSVSALNILNIYPVESGWSPCGLSSWTPGRTENQVLVDSGYFYQFLMDSGWSLGGVHLDTR
jgi:hypothetical protein